MPIKPYCLNCKMGCIHEITISSFLVPLPIEKKAKNATLIYWNTHMSSSCLDCGFSTAFRAMRQQMVFVSFMSFVPICTKKTKAGHFNYQNSPYIFYSNIFAPLNESIEITGNNVIERKLTQLLKPEKFRIFCGKDMNSTFNHHSHSTFNHHPNNLIWTIIQKTEWIK